MFAATLCLGSIAAMAQAAEDTASRIEKGRALYDAYCAACHGAEIEGQDDWQSRNADGTLRAPPHDDSGHTWHHGDRLLTDYVRLGGAALLEARGIEDFESGMPGFGETLSDDEIGAVLDFIKSRWSDRARAYQERATEAEK